MKPSPRRPGPLEKILTKIFFAAFGTDPHPISPAVLVTVKETLLARRLGIREDDLIAVAEAAAERNWERFQQAADRAIGNAGKDGVDISAER